MKRVKITVVKMVHYADLIEKYENPITLWLTNGGGDFYDGWMKNRHSAMISCNDGFRPVSFLIEAID